MDKLYHIGLDDSHQATYAILPGDPGRVEAIARKLENPRFIGQSREYTSWLGELEGEPVLVMSTGMGGPSTAIGVEELYMTGVRNFIRVGTCGGMHLDVKGGDLVIATGAIRMEGTTKEYVPIEFPAVADLELTNALAREARRKSYPYHTGVVHCKDSFYGQHDPDRMPAGHTLKNNWEAWIKANCLASEMESATLFIVSQILGARSACILNTVWNQEREGKGLDNPRVHDTSKGIEVTVEAIRSLIRQDLAQPV